MFEQKQWYWKRRTRLYVGSNELKTSFSKFKGSIFAVLFGLIIGSLVIAGTGNSAITYFHYVLYFAFSSYGFNNWDNTLVWWSLYIVAGLALVASFKTGMFNIGVPGQLLAAGSVIVAIGVRYDMSQPLTILVAFIAAVLTSMLVAGVIVILKVLFNVHEVVSSILLNWTIWYLVKWIFTTSSDLYNASQGASNPVHENMNLVIGGYKFIIPIILAFLLVFFVWFLLKKTAIGYKFKTVGLNPFAAQYAGINKKQYSVISFLISGALAGIMGFIYYVGFNPSLSFASDDLPTLGFDSISVALVGQISAIGVIGSALLWGIIKSGGPIGSTGLNIPNAIGDIIFGVIIYSAACAILLSRLEPIKFTIRYLNVTFNNTRRKVANSFIKNIWNKWITTFKTKRDYKHDINELKSEIRKINQVNKLLIKQNNQSQTSENNLKFKNLKQEINQLMIAKKDNVEVLYSQIYQEYKSLIYFMDKEYNQLIIAKKDNVEVLYSQIYQEYKSLIYFMNKEYNQIWKRGIIGITNRVSKKKKAVYGKKLNEYVKTKIAYDEFMYNSKQELKQQIKLLKTEKILKVKEKITQLKLSQKENKKTHQEKVEVLTKGFKNQLQLIEIEHKKNMQFYKDFNNEKLQEINDKYQSQIKLLKDNYQKNKENLVNDKTTFDKFIADSKQKLFDEIKIIKKEDAPTLSLKIKELVKDFKTKSNEKTEEFNQNFLQLINNEKKQVAIINQELKENKNSYKKHVKKTTEEYRNQLKTAQNKYKKEQSNKTLDLKQKEKLQENYQQEIKSIKENYKKNRQKYISNGGEN